MIKLDRIPPTPEDAAILQRSVHRVLRGFAGAPYTMQTRERMVMAVNNMLDDTIEFTPSQKDSPRG